MTHPMQKQRVQRINQVRDWYQNGMKLAMIVWRAQEEFGCTYEKALEYLSEVTRE